MRGHSQTRRPDLRDQAPPAPRGCEDPKERDALPATGLAGRGWRLVSPSPPRPTLQKQGCTPSRTPPQQPTSGRPSPQRQDPKGAPASLGGAPPPHPPPYPDTPAHGPAHGPPLAAGTRMNTHTHTRAHTTQPQSCRPRPVAALLRLLIQLSTLSPKSSCRTAPGARTTRGSPPNPVPPTPGIPGPWRWQRACLHPDAPAPCPHPTLRGKALLPPRSTSPPPPPSSRCQRHPGCEPDLTTTHCRLTYAPGDATDCP